MDGKLKIGVIVAIAFVAGIVGTLSFASFDTQIQSESIQTQAEPGNAQALAIGANVIIKAYHEDGTLYHEEIKHNTLNDVARNMIVACLTGLDTTPNGFDTCNTPAVVQILPLMKNQTTFVNYQNIATNATIILTPGGCDLQLNNYCTGFNATATFDFADLDCSIGNCLYLDRVISTDFGPQKTSFNYVLSNTQPVVGPNDRLFIEMAFHIPQ